MISVISGTGVPVAGSFPRSSEGTPIYINLATGVAYFLDASNAVQQISGGSGGGNMLKSENLSGLANYTTARSNMGLGTAATTAATAYATAAQGTSADSALQPSGNGGSLTGLTKTQVGLANVDNTSDSAKPVSTATQTALNLKADLADIPQVKIAPTTSQTIAAGYSAYVCGPYEVVTATSLEIGAGACLEIG